MNILDELIGVLEYQTSRGSQFISLSEDSRRFLFDRPVESVQPKAKSRKAGHAVPAKVDRKPPDTAPEIRTETMSRETLQKQVPELRDNLDVPLPKLREIVAACTRCDLCQTRSAAVFGVGNLEAELMFVGAGPTRADDGAGSPFSDEAGDLLGKIIEAMGYSRDVVYLTNITKCSAPGKRPPTDAEVLTCTPYLEREIELIQPKVIVLLGSGPLFCLFQKRQIGKHRGNWLTYRGIDCMPTFQPSYLLRKPEAKRDVWSDMKAVMSKLA